MRDSASAGRSFGKPWPPCVPKGWSSVVRARAYSLRTRASRTFRIVSDELRTLTEIENVLQLRLAVELEAAAIAAKKRSNEDLAHMRRLLDAIDASIAADEAAIELDFAFHRAISAATGNPYFERFMHFLGPVIIPPDRSVPSWKPRMSASSIWSISRQNTGASIRRLSGAMPRARASPCANISKEAGSVIAIRFMVNRRQARTF